MRILLAFPQADGQTGCSILRAFQDLGHEVSVLDPKINPYYLITQCREFRPDLIFCSRTKELCIDIINIKSEFPNTIIACWNVDVRDSVLEFEPALIDMFRYVDILYTIGLGNVKEYQEVLGPKVIVKHLQQGCDPLLHNKFELTEEDHAKYDCQVMMAGSFFDIPENQERIELANYLIQNKVDLKIFGVNDYIKNEEHSKACQCAKICIGMSRWPNVEQSMSVRDYKIMAAGGFLLTRYIEGIDEFFKDDSSIYECFWDKEDCLRAIKAFTSHKNLDRHRIADHAYYVVHHKHKYIDRMKQVIKDVDELLEQRINLYLNDKVPYTPGELIK